VLSPEGKLFAGNDDGDILYLFEGRRELVHAHDAGIKRLCYDPLTRRLASMSYDRTLKIWEVGDSFRLVQSASLPA
jgi:WD40 repeat protein